MSYFIDTQREDLTTYISIKNGKVVWSLELKKKGKLKTWIVENMALEISITVYIYYTWLIVSLFSGTVTPKSSQVLTTGTFI